MELLVLKQHSLLYTNLVKKGVITLEQLIQFLTEKPADTFGLEAGRLKEGRAADITIIDLEQEEEIDPTTFLSKGKIHHSQVGNAKDGR